MNDTYYIHYTSYIHNLTPYTQIYSNAVRIHTYIHTLYIHTYIHIYIHTRCSHQGDSAEAQLHRLGVKGSHGRFGKFLLLHSVRDAEHLQMYVCMYKCIYLCMTICYMYVCMYVCTYVCMFILTNEIFCTFIPWEDPPC